MISWSVCACVFIVSVSMSVPVSSVSLYCAFTYTDTLIYVFAYTLTRTQALLSDLKAGNKLHREKGHELPLVGANSTEVSYIFISYHGWSSNKAVKNLQVRSGLLHQTQIQKTVPVAVSEVLDLEIRAKSRVESTPLHFSEEACYCFCGCMLSGRSLLAWPSIIWLGQASCGLHLGIHT